jgi:hypothetical protein
MPIRHVSALYFFGGFSELYAMLFSVSCCFLQVCNISMLEYFIVRNPLEGILIGIYIYCRR